MRERTVNQAVLFTNARDREIDAQVRCLGVGRDNNRLEIWRHNYDEIRPHRSPGDKSPKEFVSARERELQTDKVAGRDA